jgi:hypothetical protein
MLARRQRETQPFSLDTSGSLRALPVPFVLQFLGMDLREKQFPLKVWR